MTSLKNILGFVLSITLFACKPAAKEKKAEIQKVQNLFYDSLQKEIAAPDNIDTNNFLVFIKGTTEQEARYKLLTPLTIKTKVNDVAQFVESKTKRWPLGTWNSGYYDRWGSGFLTYKLNIYSCPVNEQTNEAYNPSGFLSSHPMFSVNDKIIRALIHTNHLYPNASWITENNRKIRSGIDYMIDQQVKSVPKSSVFYRNEEGGFTKWYFRPDSLTPNTNEDKHNNYAHLFETAHALRAMCEAYMYFQNNSIQYGSFPGDKYDMESLYKSIVKAADNIVLKSIGKSSGLNEEGNSCDWVAPNYRGLGVWAMAGAYKVVKQKGDLEHANAYYSKAKEIAIRLIKFQTADNTIEDGMWLTGGTSGNSDGCGHETFKDTYIWYHQLVLRGLVEMIDITKDSDIKWKESELIPSVKRAVNHLIKYRVSYNDVKADTDVNWDLSNKTWVGAVKGTLRTTWTSTDHSKTCPTWAFYYYEEVVEPIALLSLYSKYQKGFSHLERSILRNLLLTIGIQSHGGYDPKDPSTLEKFVQYAYYCDYFEALKKGERIYPLHENNNLVQPSL